MKKLVTWNWLIFLTTITIAIILLFIDFEGFWSGFFIGIAFSIVAGESYWIFKESNNIRDIFFKKEPEDLL
jgi:hypothetical protein